MSFSEADEIGRVPQEASTSAVGIWHAEPDAAREAVHRFGLGRCHRTRKSIGGGAIWVGSHTVRTLAKTQAVIAKSSVEAEIYATVMGAREALGGSTLLRSIGAK